MIYWKESQTQIAKAFSGLRVVIKIMRSRVSSVFVLLPYLHLAACRLCCIVDHARARQEENHVDEHDDGERAGEENEQGALLAEPTQLCACDTNRFELCFSVKSGNL